jgi:hypothetical protein
VAEVHGSAVPNFVGPRGHALAKSIWDKGGFTFSMDGLTVQRNLPKAVAGMVTAIDGKRSLNEIRAKLGWETKPFLQGFNNLYQPLNNFNLVRFSARRGL